MLRLQYERLYFNSVHYQGYAKKKLVEDVCNIMANARFTSPPPPIEDAGSSSSSSSSSSIGGTSSGSSNSSISSGSSSSSTTSSTSSSSSSSGSGKQRKKANDYVIKDSDVQRVCDSYYLTSGSKSNKPTEDYLLLQDRHELEKKTVTTFILGTIIRWIMHYIKL